MRRWIAASLGLAPFGIIASCSSFSGTMGAVDAGGEQDASSDVIDLVDALIDGAADRDADASTVDACVTLIDDDFSQGVDSSWIISGVTPTIDNGEVVLTQDGQSGNNGIWHAAVSPASALLRIQATLHITGSGTIADGMAIAWLPANPNDATGSFLKTSAGGGDELGVCDYGNGININTLALGIATYLTPQLRILDESMPTSCESDLHNATLGKDPFQVELDILGKSLKGQFLGNVDTVVARSTDVAWIGFTASSGEFTSRQALSHVVVQSCP